jgi:Domain of unknown function (DUF6531)
MVFTSLSLTVSGRASAAVNMWSGGFQKTWTDLEFSGRSSLSLKRNYNSRSMTTGLFGFGWCLEDLEARLKPLTDDNWRLVTCLGPVDFVKQGNGEWVHELSGSMLLKTPMGLERKTEDGGSQIFSMSGGLERIRRPNGEILAVTRDSQGRPERIASSLGPQIKIVYDPQNSRVVRVEASENVTGKISKLAYRYKEGNLTEAADEAASLFLYSYDAFHNLTRTDYSDKTFETLNYDDAQDHVSRIRTRDNCVETYQFQTPEKEHLVSTAEKSCAGQKISSTRHEYWHRTDGEGRVYLSQARVTQGKTVVSRNFEPRGRRMTASTIGTELPPLHIERRH